MIQNKQEVNAEVTNAAFVSKTADSTTVGKINLQSPTSGSSVADVQQVINNILSDVNDLDSTSSDLVVDVEDLQDRVDVLEGTSGGGGSSFQWKPSSDNGAVKDYINDIEFFSFEIGQSIVSNMPIPINFVLGTFIGLKAKFFTSLTTGVKYKFQLDVEMYSEDSNLLIASGTHQSSDELDLVTAVQNQLNTLGFDVTDENGQFELSGSPIDISAGCLLKLKLTRIAASSNEAADPINMIITSVEAI